MMMTILLQNAVNDHGKNRNDTDEDKNVAESVFVVVSYPEHWHYQKADAKVAIKVC